LLPLSSCRHPVDPGETNPELADKDGDGIQDGPEVRTGTDPLNPASQLVAFVELTNGLASVLSWSSTTNAYYCLERSGSLEPPSWSILADDLQGQDGATTYLLPPLAPGDTNTYYRVLLK